MSFMDREWSYVRVLVAELFLLFLATFMENYVLLYVLFVAALLFIFGTVIASIWQSPVPRILAFVFGAIAVVSGFVWAIPGMSEKTITIAFAICTFSYAAFALISIVAMLRNVFEVEKVTVNRIVGSICIYILIGMFFTFIYAGIDLLLPNTFTFAGVQMFSLDNLPDYLYFSFTTLTTLGYGDIVPLVRFSRLVAMFEAITGQIYLVVMVATLVGMHVSRRVAASRSKG